MPFLLDGKIRYFQFELIGQGLIHAVFTRQGGVSPEPWAALNLGSMVGDDKERVRENQRLALAAESHACSQHTYRRMIIEP